MRKRLAWLAASATMLLLGGASARAMSLGDTNLVDLVRDSDSIVVGTIQQVSDGIDERGIPYTEVTIEIGETILGNLGGGYTFRQFGLREPRLTEDGTMKRMPAPAGFPTWKEGENVLLFLAPTAQWTGLRTTVGLMQGKFVLGPGRVENELANAGVFRNVSLDDGLATENDVRMLATEIGAVSPDTLLGLVRRAVGEQWVQKGMMWRTDEGKPVYRPGRPTRPGRPGDKNSIPRTGTGSTGSTPTLGVK